MTPSELDLIIKEAPEDIRIRLGELAPKIREAAAAKLEESQENEKAAVLSVSIALKIDLAMAPVTWEVVAKVGATYTSTGPEHVAETTPDLGLEVERRAK